MSKKIFIFIIAVLSLSFTASHFALADNPPSGRIRVVDVDGNTAVTVVVGENITIIVTGRDDYGVFSVDAYYSGTWNRQECEGFQTICEKTWKITESTADQYIYYGRVRSARGYTFAEPMGVTVTFNAAAPRVPSSPRIADSDPVAGDTVSPGVRTVSLNWDPVAGATYYQWRPASGMAFINTGMTTEASQEANLRVGSYQMQVRACNATDCGLSSDVIFNVAPEVGVPPAPTIDAPDSAKVNTKVKIKIIATDDKDVKKITLKYGDGQAPFLWDCPLVGDKSCEVSVRHTYTSAETYTIEAQTLDSDGNSSDWARKKITISSAGEIPPGESPVLGGVVRLVNPLKDIDSLEELLDAIINFIFWVGMALAPIMLIIAGFMYVISAGIPDKIKLAQNIALYTFIGLAVLLFAKGLVAVLISVLGG